MRRVELGYLCRKGHFCWFSDEEESGQCGAPGMGRIFLEVEPDWDNTDAAHVDRMIAEAERGLAEQITIWRAS